MTQYKPHVVEEDNRSAWEKRHTGIHGHFAELEEAKHEREEETAPNPTVAHGGASGKPYQELIDVNVGKVSGKRRRR